MWKRTHICKGFRSDDAVICLKHWFVQFTIVHKSQDYDVGNVLSTSVLSDMWEVRKKKHWWSVELQWWSLSLCIYFLYPELSTFPSTALSMEPFGHIYVNVIMTSLEKAPGRVTTSMYHWIRYSTDICCKICYPKIIKLYSL